MRLSSLALGLLLRGSSTHASAFTLPSSSAPPTSALIRSNARRITRTTPASSSLLTTVRGGSTQRNMVERPFETWTFDSPCGTMEWTPVPSVALSASPAGESAADDADLVIVGVFAPKKDEEEGDESEEKEVDPIAFEGAAKDLDEKLGGALTELAADNAKAFQNGGSAGSGE